MEIQYVIGIIGGSIAIVAGGGALIMKFLNPNIKQDNEIANLDHAVDMVKDCQEKTAKSLEKLDDKVERIMTNHLPHIEVALVKLETEVKNMGENNSLQTKLIIDKLNGFGGTDK